MTSVRLAMRDGSPAARHAPAVEGIVAASLAGVPKLLHRFVGGTVDLF
jgi:hypothetical protein